MARECPGVKQTIIERYLKAAAGDKGAAIQRVKEYAKWRQEVLNADSGENDWRVAEFIPNKLNDGVWAIKLGEIKVAEVLSEVSQSDVRNYFLRQVDNMAQKCQQVMIVLDMKGVSLKTLTTHSLTTIITALLKDLVQYYPNFLKAAYLLSTPIFVPDLLESLLRPLVPEDTFEKIVFTGETNHPDIPSSFLFCYENNNDSLSQGSYDEEQVKEEEEIEEMEEGSRMSESQIGQVNGEIGTNRRVL